MLTKQFQDEAVAVSTASRIEQFVSKDFVDLTQGHGVILTMVIRLLLSGWITDKEKVFLDGQAPEDCLTFLISGKDYIHPEGVDLFPFEVIETTSLHGGEAIFSHRYQPETMKASYQPYRIFSAAINPRESEKIILGFFGPSHRLGTIDEDCGYSRLIYSFRDAYSAVKDDLPVLKRHVGRRKPTLLVDRSTGRTVAINKAASRSFDRQPRAIVDVSLDQLKYHLKPLLPRYNLKMENLSAAGLGLSVVSLEPNSEPDDNGREAMSLLKTQLLGGSARIRLVSNRLLDAVDGAHPSAIPLRTLQGEAERLNLAVRQYSFLMDRSDTVEGEQNVLSELRNAIDRIASDTDQEPVIVGSEESSNFTRVAPEGTYRLLFESIMEGHMWYSSLEGGHWIKIKEPEKAGLRLRFETTLNEQPTAGQSSSENEKFIHFLAKLLKIELVKSFCIEDNTLLTEIIIKP